MSGYGATGLGQSEEAAWDAADIAGIAVIVVGGTGLAWACRWHPAALPAWAPWEFSWVEYLSAAEALWCYGRGVARSGAGRRPSVWRQVAFLAGVLLAYAALQTRFDYLAQHMFFLSRVQHVTTHHLGPFLIALAWPGATLRRGMSRPLRRLVEHPAVARAGRAVQQPVLAAVLFAGLIVLWLIPVVHFRAMLDVRLYAFMNWTMLGDGLLFWVLILDPRSKPPALLSFGARLLLVMSVQIPQVMLGALISLTSQDLYPFYELCGRIYPGISPAVDQQIGGLIITYGGGMMSAVAALILFHRSWRAEAAKVSV